VSLREWLARVNLPAPIRTAEGGAVTFIVQSGTNAFRFNPGNTLMRLNKMQCWLGFAPKLIGDNLYLHVIDLEKSLYPLAFPRSSPQLSGLIMIDPGHGGDHPGTKSVFENKFEKDYTLDWALRTQRILQQRGYRVVLTRTNDSDIPIPERILMADRLNASLFISLHFNSAFPNVEQAGIETFCLTPMGSSSHLTRGYDDDVRTSLPNNQQDAANLQLAARVHQHLLASTQANDRGIRRARFMAILRTQRRPALLIEAGYLSNPREARLIADATYRQKLAEGLANALSDRTVADTR
jgi:N-acetylmuramoyl-L-alanine amidase